MSDVYLVNKDCQFCRAFRRFCAFLVKPKSSNEDVFASALLSTSRIRQTNRMCKLLCPTTPRWSVKQSWRPCVCPCVCLVCPVPVAQKRWVYGDNKTKKH